jgi:hypothetical protein
MLGDRRLVEALAVVQSIENACVSKKVAAAAETKYIDS